MASVTEEQVLPRIRSLAPNDSFQVRLRTFGLSESVVGRKRRTTSTHPPTAVPKAAEPGRSADVPTMQSAERPTPEPPPGASAPDETLISASHAGSKPPTGPAPTWTEISGSGARPVSRSGASALPAASTGPTAPIPGAKLTPAKPAGAQGANSKSGGKGPIVGVAALVLLAIG